MDIHRLDVYLAMLNRAYNVGQDQQTIIMS